MKQSDKKKAVKEKKDRNRERMRKEERDLERS
jgi:hypothetical protein